MSLFTGDSFKSSSDSSSSRLSPLLHHNKHDDSTESSELSRPASIKDEKNIDSRVKAKREVYRYESDWLVSSIAWSHTEDESFELAIGSFIEEYCNKINIVKLSKDSFDEEIELETSFDHPYPPTKISWIPKAPGSSNQQLPKLLATSADYLRIWRIPSDSFSKRRKQEENFNNNVTECDSTSEILAEEVRLECSLSPNDTTKYRSPLTSFDWNEIDPKIIITSCVDTTCAVWDIEVGQTISSTSNKISYQLKNQILAHDHEVYDVSFSRQGTGRDIFATAGGDGSLRLFDLRMLSTSTVLYETMRHDSSFPTRVEDRALVRVSCNKQDPNYVGTFSLNSKDLMLVDIRRPGKAVVTLSSHKDNLNGISWAPHSAHHLCSASDDCQALIWGLSNMQDDANEPVLAYRANSKINAINWSTSHPDWIGIGFQNCLELLRV